MRKSAIAAGIALAVTAVGVYELGVSRAGARPAQSLTPELSKDLDLASAAGVEYAPALQTVSAVERSSHGKSAATGAPRRPQPKADPAPRKVEVGEETGVAVAPDPEETQIVQVADGPDAPEPTPTDEPAPVYTPRPVPIPVGYPGRDGNGGGGYGGTGRGGMGGGIGGVLVGVVIRGGAVDGDHCDPRPRGGRGGIAVNDRMPRTGPPIIPAGGRGRGTIIGL